MGQSNGIDVASAKEPCEKQMLKSSSKRKVCRRKAGAPEWLKSDTPSNERLIRNDFCCSSKSKEGKWKAFASML